MVTDEQVESLVKQISEMQEQVLRKSIRAMLEAFHDDRASNADKKLTKTAALAEQSESSADAFAVRNDQGYWVGIWNDKAIAQSVVARSQPSHNEVIVPIKVLPPLPKE